MWTCELTIISKSYALMKSTTTYIIIPSLFRLGNNSLSFVFIIMPTDNLHLKLYKYLWKIITSRYSV
jgi:hypothetical protein